MEPATSLGSEVWAIVTEPFGATGTPRAPEAAGVVDELEAARSGDRAALTRLLRARLPRLRNLIRYLVRSDREVDDIAQESMIAIVRGLPSYRGEGSLDAWCERITAREAIRHRRALVVRASHEDTDALESVATHDTPEQLVERRRAVGLLDALPDAQRDVIVLHHVLGLSLPEVALELDVAFETARSRLRLGMQKLRVDAGASPSSSDPEARS